MAIVENRKAKIGQNWSKQSACAALRSYVQTEVATLTLLGAGGVHGDFCPGSQGPPILIPLGVKIERKILCKLFLTIRIDYFRTITHIGKKKSFKGAKKFRTLLR